MMLLMVIKTCIFTEFLVLSCNTENWNNTFIFFCRIIYVDLTMSTSNVLVFASRKKRMGDIFFQYVRKTKKKMVLILIKSCRFVGRPRFFLFFRILLLWFSYNI